MREQKWLLGFYKARALLFMICCRPPPSLQSVNESATLKATDLGEVKKDEDAYFCFVLMIHPKASPQHRSWEYSWR